MFIAGDSLVSFVLDLKAKPNIDIFLPVIVPKSLSITKDEILFCCQ